MKNYFQKILTLFTRSEYPKSTQQEFYRWLVDKEHTSEKKMHYLLSGRKLFNKRLYLIHTNHTSN